MCSKNVLTPFMNNTVCENRVIQTVKLYTVYIIQKYKDKQICAQIDKTVF